MFAPGETTKTITVLVGGDTDYEGTEHFIVNLSSAKGAKIADATAYGVIVDDGDPPPDYGDGGGPAPPPDFGGYPYY